MRPLLYRDKKLAYHLHENLSRLYLGANESRRRTLLFGIIATLGWVAVVSNMTPLPKSPHVYNHLGMLAVASCIAASTHRNFNKAVTAQKESLSLIKKLRTTRSSEDLHVIRLKTQALSQKYPHYLNNYKSRIKD